MIQGSKIFKSGELHEKQLRYRCVCRIVKQHWLVLFGTTICFRGIIG